MINRKLTKWEQSRRGVVKWYYDFIENNIVIPPSSGLTITSTPETVYNEIQLEKYGENNEGKSDYTILKEGGLL